MALGYQRGDTSVKCPYYVGGKDKAIVCSGGIDPDGRTECRFRTMSRKKDHMERFCREAYGACPLCRQNDAALHFKRPPSA